MSVKSSTPCPLVKISKIIRSRAPAPRSQATSESHSLVGVQPLMLPLGSSCLSAGTNTMPDQLLLVGQVADKSQAVDLSIMPTSILPFTIQHLNLLRNSPFHVTVSKLTTPALATLSWTICNDSISALDCWKLVQSFSSCGLQSSSLSGEGIDDSRP
jgi:hypothetical protein